MSELTPDHFARAKIPIDPIVPADDTAKTLKRIETRLCRLMVAQGVPPNGTMVDQIRVDPADGTDAADLHLPSSHVTVADLLVLMERYHPDVEFELLVDGKRVAAIQRIA